MADIIVVVGDQPGHQGGDEAHRVAHSVDHAHQGPSKVIPDICRKFP